MEISKIQQLCKAGSIRWTLHVMTRLVQRNISTSDVEYAIMNGEIIEQYEDDAPYPSCLIFGTVVAGQPLHVVCGIAPDELWLITAYYPSKEEWKPDFKHRKRR